MVNAYVLTVRLLKRKANYYKEAKAANQQNASTDQRQLAPNNAGNTRVVLLRLLFLYLASLLSILCHRATLLQKEKCANGLGDTESMLHRKFVQFALTVIKKSI